MKKQVYVISSLVIIILIAIFVLLNMADTVVNFGFTTIKMPLILIVLVSLLLGALLIFLFSSISSFKNSRQKKASLKEIEKLQKQITDLETKLGEVEAQEPTEDPATHDDSESDGNHETEDK